MRKIFLPILLLFFAPLCYSGNNKDQCPTTVSLAINGQGNNVSVVSGGVLNLEFHYSISNDPSGPTVINQIMFGYDNNRYVDCIYNGIPSVCPSATSSSKPFRLKAPLQPGTYHIYYSTSMDYGCKPALFRSQTLVGTFTVTGSADQQQPVTVNKTCNTNVTVNINNQGNDITVAPLTPLQLSFNYNISNIPSGATTINQILVGYDNNLYVGCIYNGIPAVCPATTDGNKGLQVTAPANPGVYHIFYSTSMDYNCKPTNYHMDHQLGTVTVKAAQSLPAEKVSCTYDISMTMNDQKDSIVVDPGARVKLSFAYSVFNMPVCPNCIKQIMFGFPNQYLGCVYTGKPAVCPQTSAGTFNQALIAPSAPGRYNIHADFTFSKDFVCNPDSFVARRKLGTLIVRAPSIVKNKIPPVEETRTDKSLIQAQNNNNTLAGPARYFALIIGESNYQEDRLNLDRPVKDAHAFHDVLVSHYTFNDSNVILMLSPTREKILAQLFKYRKIITHNDNLLIFYAGHGYYDKDADQGYWWPSDAKHDNPANWLSNSDLKDEIKSIGSQHTLLISDACFSGGIFKVRDVSSLMDAPNDIKQIYSLPSRRAITSGTMTTVPDNSAFLQYLDKNLSQNTTKYLSSQELFYKMRSAVIGNSPVVPQTGVIYGAGDEGGDFIFILKN